MPRDLLLLAEMIDAGERIVAIVARIDAADPGGDRDLLEALLWNYTVLGEAATLVSDDRKAAYPEIEWRDPIRLRNRIVHGYWSVDLDVLVSTAREDVPALIEALRQVDDDR